MNRWIDSRKMTCLNFISCIWRFIQNRSVKAAGVKVRQQFLIKDGFADAISSGHTAVLLQCRRILGTLRAFRPVPAVIVCCFWCMYVRTRPHYKTIR